MTPRLPLECKGNYSATSNIMKLVHWLLMGGLLHLQRRTPGLPAMVHVASPCPANLLEQSAAATEVKLASLTLQQFCDHLKTVLFSHSCY